MATTADAIPSPVQTTLAVLEDRSAKGASAMVTQGGYRYTAVSGMCAVPMRTAVSRQVAGSYMWPIGIEVGAAYRYNSGTLASRTFLASGRNLPIEGDAFEYAGITSVHWIADDAVGSLQNPGWNQLDLRAQYKARFPRGLGAEFFVDIFNVFDNQDSIRDQDIVAGSGGTAFGEPIRFLDPRRFFLGARLTF